jgi:phosphatidylserine/phosphatidylglycerophosphate/cardiolipin synthase-like enzyme
MQIPPLLLLVSLSLTLLLSPATASADAVDQLCDPAHEDCRAPLLRYIAKETDGIDVAFWFMTDATFVRALVARHAAGVRVRVLMDDRATARYPENATSLAALAAAGVPMRQNARGGNHWKMMHFAAQGIVEFSGANYSPYAFRYSGEVPYQNYIDEVIYFTSDPDVVLTMRTRFEHLWTHPADYVDYANITTTAARAYEPSPLHPDLNFPPDESFADRSAPLYDAETEAIDTVMYRVVDWRHVGPLLWAIMRGVRVRIITEMVPYRDPAYASHALFVDLLHVWGAQVRVRAHAGLNHQKSTILHGQRLSIFGSSNWTDWSSEIAHEHNYFTAKPHLFEWLREQFERKWGNTTGVEETAPFVPLPAPPPVNVAPADRSTQDARPVTVTWHGGLYAFSYEVWYGSDPLNLRRFPEDAGVGLDLGPSWTATDYKSVTLPALDGGTTYYWRVVSKTAAGLTSVGPTWRFTTSGLPPAPPPTLTVAAEDVLLYGTEAPTLAGKWRIEPDRTAATGGAVATPNDKAAKVITPQAEPADFVEFEFEADAGRPYHLWIRGRAAGASYENDSVFVQFTDSVDASGRPAYRIGSSSALTVTLEECTSCGLSGWAWQDNGFGAGVFGTDVYFASSGRRRLRVQVREDGMALDQILLSPGQYLRASPGLPRNDATILGRSALTAARDADDRRE